MGANFGPDHVAGYQGTSIIRGPQGFPRSLPEAAVCPEDVKQDRRIDSRPHRVFVFLAKPARDASDALGLGPRISSRRASTGFGSLRRPKS